MTPLITILLIHIGSDTYGKRYPSQMDCSNALMTIAESDESFLGKNVWLQCVRTYAPSQSPRPRASGDN